MIKIDIATNDQYSREIYYRNRIIKMATYTNAYIVCINHIDALQGSIQFGSIYHDIKRTIYND